MVIGYGIFDILHLTKRIQTTAGANEVHTDLHRGNSYGMR